MFRLDNKIGIITGAARGIGSAIARTLASQGATVALVDILLDEVSALASEIGPTARAYEADLAKIDNINAVVKKIASDYGSIDILDIVEIIPETGFYDYQSKYTKGMTKYISPADIDNKTTNLVKKEAKKIYKSLGCRHYARVDFLLDQESKPYLLEVNTLPGLCETSLFPMSAESKGINFTKLLDLIINILIIDNDIVL